MSTRSIIVITDSKTTHRIYKHCDGYPTANLTHLAIAINRFHSVNTAKDFAILLVDSIHHDGAKCELEESYSHAFTVDTLGNQGDLEWMYVVNPESKYVNVYECRFDSNKDNADYYMEGPTNPNSPKILKSIVDEYRWEWISTNSKAIQEFKKHGYIFNKSDPNAVLPSKGESELERLGFEKVSTISLWKYQGYTVTYDGAQYQARCPMGQLLVSTSSSDSCLGYIQENIAMNQEHEEEIEVLTPKPDDMRQALNLLTGKPVLKVIK